MDMIFIGVNFFDDEVGTVVGQSLEYFKQVTLNAGIENLASVFGWPHKMIVTGEYGMAHSTIHCHATSMTVWKLKCKDDAGWAYSPDLTVGELRHGLKCCLSAQCMRYLTNYVCRYNQGRYNP